MRIRVRDIKYVKERLNDIMHRDHLLIKDYYFISVNAYSNEVFISYHGRDKAVYLSRFGNKRKKFIESLINEKVKEDNIFSIISLKPEQFYKLFMALKIIG